MIHAAAPEPNQRAAESLAAFLSWLDSDAYLRHVDACARWAADDPRLIVGHVGSYG